MQNLKQSLNEQGIDNPRMKWELLKYEVRKFSITYSKKLARERKLNYAEIENQIKDIENTKGWEHVEEKFLQHDILLKRLEERSNYITEGIILRSKAKWYELG